MGDDSESVYDLITKLSEKFAGKLNGSHHKNVKRLRAKSFEMLLSKCDKELAPPPDCLEGNKDPICHLLAWELELITDHNLKKHAEKLHECMKKFDELPCSDKKTLNGILFLLLQLRKVPEGDDDFMDKSVPSTFRLQPSTIQSCYRLSNTMPFNENMFRLPAALSCSDMKYTNDTFRLIPQKSKMKRIVPKEKKSLSVSVLYNQPTMNLFHCPSENKSISRSNDGDIWEIASKADMVDNRTWESYGRGFAEKEPPFLSELGDEAHLWTEYMVALENTLTFDKEKSTKTKILDRKTFTKDAKYMLVGIVSKTFLLNDSGEFYLNPEVALENLTPSTLQQYVEELTFAGNCYRALSLFVTANEGHKERGYIFSELCESVKRYLGFHRFAILSQSDNTNLLVLHGHVRKLKEYLKLLTSICKVGPHKTSEGGLPPNGAELLNYLYKRVFSITNHDVLMILYSMLYPCCQVYFSRFLQRWILEGTLNDPYGEFFVQINAKYVTTRGRTFWTRAHVIHEPNVPEFLSLTKNEILSCGKAMNLLRICAPNSPLQVHLRSKKPALFASCFSAEQLKSAEQNTARYNLEACAACGPLFSLADKTRELREQDPTFLEMVAKKRLATIKRLELERQKKIQEEMERKAEAAALLKEQCDIAIQQKQKRIARDIKRDICYAEKDLEIEQLRNKLIEEEAQSMIAYYSELSDISEKRHKKIEEHNKQLKVKLESTRVDVVTSPPIKVEDIEIVETKECSSVVCADLEEQKSLSKSVSADTFSTAMETSESECTTTEEYTAVEMHSSKSLDLLNANLEVVEECEPKKEINENFLIAQENFMAALKNKAKVMSLELGIETPKPQITPKARTKYGLHDHTLLTDAQKNKLRVMSSEFGIEIGDDPFVRKHTEKTQMQLNREKMMVSSECFYASDNANYTNQNVAQAPRDTKHLTLTLRPQKQTPPQKPTPMSVDSTPLSEVPSTPSTSKFWQLLAPSTATTNPTEEVFDFKRQDDAPPAALVSRNSKWASREAVERMRTNSLHLFLPQSVSVPLAAQAQLVNQEVLRYFVEDLRYLQHLESLRDYFFLQDGEFGRNITEGLFEKLYDVNFPVELINCRTLQFLVHKALNSSSKCGENSDCLSFKINNLPRRFNLGDLSVLDCLSLSYKIVWPLNVLLPADTIEKYDEVFKYLLKLNRVSWVQKKIFEELKFLCKQVGRNQMFLTSSPQYRRIHQCRHVMSHFIQTFQNYIVGDVLQCNWEIFTRNLADVTNLDQLYSVHTTYIKNILSMCLLNERAAPIRKVLEKIFIVILKFYDYLRSQSWTIEDGHYVHPNFDKLESIFLNFDKFVMYMFKVGRKIVKTGYQPYFVQLLDMLDINGYYDRRSNAVPSC